MRSIVWLYLLALLPNIVDHFHQMIYDLFCLISRMVQNLTREQWPLEKVNRKLETKMSKAFNDVVAIAEKEESDMRTGALMLGVGRVANAIKVLGLWP